MVTAPLLGCEYSSKIPSILRCLDFAPRGGDGPNVDWMKAAALFFRVRTGELAVEDEDASLIMRLIGIGVQWEDAAVKLLWCGGLSNMPILLIVPLTDERCCSTDAVALVSSVGERLGVMSANGQWVIGHDGAVVWIDRIEAIVVIAITVMSQWIMSYLSAAMMWGVWFFCV
jgi:hypothetical protein